MYELECPSCNKPSHYNFSDYLLLCPICSATFHLDSDSGHKEIFSGHYIVANTLDQNAVKELAIEWLKRIHHKPSSVEGEFFIVELKGISLPLWVVSLEAHTAWKGLVRKHSRNPSHASSQDYLVESGQFRRSYRWSVSARQNICEMWGLTRLHKPTEPLVVEWDGFPFDSTLSRGRLEADESKPAYEARNFFEFKYSNGVPILGVQVDEEEGLRRAENHVKQYHYRVACLNADYLLDHRTELEIAGIQLIHVPIWRVSYVYRPRSLARFFVPPKEKKLLIDGHGKGVLVGELALVYHDKMLINSYVTGFASIILFLLAMSWHPAFALVAIFSLCISAASAFSSLKMRKMKEEEELRKLSSTIGAKTPAQAVP